MTVGGRVQLLQSSWQLQVTAVELSDAGTYVCSIIQDGSVQATGSATVQVIGECQCGGGKGQ